MNWFTKAKDILGDVGQFAKGAAKGAVTLLAQSGQTPFSDQGDITSLAGTQSLKQPRTPNPLPNALYGALRPSQEAPRAERIGFAAGSLSPGSELLTPALEKKGVSPIFAGAAGLLADIATPGPGEFRGLTTKTLSRLPKSGTVSRQFVEDLAKMADVKKAEKDVIARVLGEDAKLDVQDFSNRVKTELLPLERAFTLDESSGALYESITLPEDVRGPVAEYREHLYGSPIKTSAASVHFNEDEFPNYFAHTRIEDLPNSDIKSTDRGMFKTHAGEVGSPVPTGNTRRVIELQSDLFQRGRLESEFSGRGKLSKDVSGTKSEALDMLPPSERSEYTKILTTPREKITPGILSRAKELEEKAVSLFDGGTAKDRAKLEPYRNTWHERIIREEVKQAAMDGKTKLQFPTGETAMKIEGLGENLTWYDAKMWGDYSRTGNAALESKALGQEDLSAGQEIVRASERGREESWVITDVLGDGKFKAVPKDVYDKVKSGANYLSLERDKETFDISGKVDEKNPIYQFYEKEVGKYLKNKYGAKLVTDPQGVKWWEVDVDQGKAKQPVEAFGFGLAAPLLAGQVSDYEHSAIEAEQNPRPSLKNIVAHGTNYDPYDPSQNRPDSKPEDIGKGAAGVPITSRMVAVSRKSKGSQEPILPYGTVVRNRQTGEEYLVADLKGPESYGDYQVDFATPHQGKKNVTKFQGPHDFDVVEWGTGKPDARNKATQFAEKDEPAVATETPPGSPKTAQGGGFDAMLRALASIGKVFQNQTITASGPSSVARR